MLPFVNVALLIQHVTSRHVAICDLSASTSFSALSYKRHDFRDKVTGHKMYILIYSTTFVMKQFPFWEEFSEIISCENVFVQSTRYSCRILMENLFSRQILEKKNQILIFIKICLVGAELFHADRQTDMTKLIVAFRNFLNAPKIDLLMILLKYLDTEILKIFL